MRTISKGRKAEMAIEKRATCRNCGAVVGYVPRDVKSYSGRDMSGGPDGCEWVNCPECRARIVLRSW